MALGLVTAGTITPTVASATDYAYTGSCSVHGTAAGTVIDVTRSFRARVHRARDTAHPSRWNLSGYEYSYTVTPDIAWGPRSDERLTMNRGRISGTSPWYSPDTHTSNVAWVSEKGWKGQSSVGSSQLSFHAWFDVPSKNDPECTTNTATF